MCKSKITRGKLHSGSNRNRAGKLLQTLPPSNSRDFIDYPPPLEIGPETPSTSTTPLEFTGLHRLPHPSKSGRKTPSTTNSPPTPLEIGPENSFNYPPRIHGTSSTTPPPSGNRVGKLLNYPPSNFGIDGSSSPQLLRCGCAPGGMLP